MTMKFPEECGETKDMKEYGLTDVTVKVPHQPYAPLPYRTTEADQMEGISEGSISQKSRGMNPSAFLVVSQGFWSFLARPETNK